MKIRIYRLRYFMAALSMTFAIGLLTGDAAAMQGVELSGYTLDGAAKMSKTPQQQEAVDAFESFCDNSDSDRRKYLEGLYTTLEVQVASKLAEAGKGAATDFFPSEAEIDKMLDAVEEECDREDDKGNFGLTTLIYSECRMTMDGETGQLDFKIPDGSDGHMIVFDGAEGAKVNLTQRVQEVSELVGEGWSSGIQWQAGLGQTVDLAGYSATSAQFEYTVGMGPGNGSGLAASQQAAEGQMSTEQYMQQMESAGLGESQALQMLGGMVSNKVTGWGYFSTEVPGIDIVRSFYTNFAENVSPSGNVGSFFGGMITSSVGLLEKGIPLEIHTTLETKLMGRTKITGKSMSKIYDVKLVDLPSDWCTRSFIDESKLTDVDAQIQQALAGASGQGAGGTSGSAGAAPAPGMTSEQAAQYNKGMEALSQAMQQMTPEQKQALQGMGLDSMIPGMAGNAAVQTAAAPGGSAGGGQSGSGPSSADLTTDNMTQSVQKHLQALGYDPGNTSGDLSTETIIAISQFQAENGMEVTGEVTPQLLGILGAKVDSHAPQ